MSFNREKINKLRIKCIKKYTNENIVYIIILITIIWLIFLLLGNITIPKLILFSKILLIIYIYKYLYANLAEQVKEKTKINYVRKKWGWREEKQWINIKKVVEKIKINKILYILIKISTINNIILYLIPRIELKLYDYLESMKNNKINENFKQGLVILFLSVCIIPWKIMLYKMYNILSNLNKLTMYEILCKRMFGLILIFSDLINNIVENVCNNSIIQFSVYIYIIIIIVIILDYILERDQISKYIKFNLNVLKIHEKRVEASILSKVIKTVWEQKYINKKEFIKEYGLKLSFEWLDVYILSIRNAKFKIIESKLITINIIKEIRQNIKKNKIFIDYLFTLARNKGRYVNGKLWPFKILWII